MILLISHGNHRTGAPISLLNFARILKNNGYDLLILAKTDGELTPEFEKLGEVLIWDIPWSYEPNPIKRISNRLFRNNDLRKKKILKKISQSNIELVINNTITNGDILSALSHLNLKTVTWVHEMEIVIRIFDVQPNNLVKDTFCFSHSYLAASQAVKDNLVEKHKVAADSIYVIYEIIDNLENNNADPIPEDVQKMKTSDAFLIGGCGQNGWRKGTDLFLQVAKQLITDHPELPFKFIWIGGNPSHGTFLEFEEEVNLLGLENCVTIIPHNDRVSAYYRILDLYLLTSREDPFPLAMLEAGNSGLPILGFRKSGGVEELVEDFCLVQYTDVIGMAQKVVELYQDHERTKEIGNRNRLTCSQFQWSIKTHEVLERIKTYME